MDQLSIRVGGQEAALLVVASGETLQAGDSVLFYVPATEEAEACEVVLKAEPRRMGWAYAEPRGEGAVWTGVAHADGTLPFKVTHEWQRYLLVGFERDGAIVLDISDPWNPNVLFDYAVLDIPGQSGLYLSHETEDSADCIAIQLDAVRDVIEVTTP